MSLSSVEIPRLWVGLTIIALVLVQHVVAQSNAALKDLVLDLPGWDQPLPSRWFSGHVSAGSKDGKELFHHYILIESETNVAKAPVVLWSNGGPGAASIFGLMVELGPLLISGKSNGQLFRNEYSWSKEANLLIINGPPPVGFSYCSPPGPAGDFKSCGTWNDSTTAYHNRIAIESIIERHPFLKTRDWFLTGESYAGIYIPTLLRELLDNGPKDLKLRGMAVGNACMGTDVLCFADADYWWRAVFLRGHAQVSDASFERFEKECRASMEKGVVTDTCKKKATELEKEAGAFYEYDVFSECWYDGDFAPPKKLLARKPGVFSIGGDEFCGSEDALTKWLGKPVVRRALNVALDSEFCSGDNGVGFKYDATEKDLRPFYHRLIGMKNMRVMVYSGDTDVSVNVFSSQNWTRGLGVKEKQGWRPWTLDGRRAVVGYVTQYEKDFSFVTIRGTFKGTLESMHTTTTD